MTMYNCLTQYSTEQFW